MKSIDPVHLNSLDPMPKAPSKRADSSIEPKSANTALKPCGDIYEHNQQSISSPSLILVADDDPMIRLLTQQALDDAAFEVIQAENGKEALEIFEKYAPDLILCDVMMPQIDGFELCASIGR